MTTAEATLQKISLPRDTLKSPTTKRRPTLMKKKQSLDHVTSVKSIRSPVETRDFKRSGSRSTLHKAFSHANLAVTNKTSRSISTAQVKDKQAKEKANIRDSKRRADLSYDRRKTTALS